MNRPKRKQLTPADKAWLFSKTIVFLGVSMGSILLAVAMAVFLGSSALMMTESKFLGACVGLAGYMAGMAGRDWLEFFLMQRLFTEDEAAEINSTSRGDKNGPEDT